MKAGLITALLLVMAGCGQKGALYLDAPADAGARQEAPAASQQPKADED